MNVYEGILNRQKKGKKSMWVLLDPDRQSPREAALYGERCEQSGADM